MPRCTAAACAGVARRSAARMKGKGPAARGGPSSLFGEKVKRESGHYHARREKRTTAEALLSSRRERIKARR
jgi:hypothetical protein